MNELTINLDSRSKKPLYEQIYDYIKSDIQNGRIPYGEKLPSTRALAKHLEVSRSTVELAYEQLLSEGYIESAPYRGFFVAQIDELYQLKKEEKKSERKIEKKKVYQYSHSYTICHSDGFHMLPFQESSLRRMNESAYTPMSSIAPPARLRLKKRNLLRI